MSNMTTNNVPDKPHQPASFNFPQRSFGQKKVVHRSFQPSWFNHWQFLHYDESRDVVFCHTCLKGFDNNEILPFDYTIFRKDRSSRGGGQKKMKSNRADPAFVCNSSYTLSAVAKL